MVNVNSSVVRQEDAPHVDAVIQAFMDLKTIDEHLKKQEDGISTVGLGIAERVRYAITPSPTIGQMELRQIDNLLDKLDQQNGDAPHRAVDRLTRIRVLAGKNSIEALFDKGGNFGKLIERMAQNFIDQHRCTLADIQIVESKKIGQSPDIIETRWTIERRDSRTQQSRFDEFYREVYATIQAVRKQGEARGFRFPHADRIIKLCDNFQSGKPIQEGLMDGGLI